MLKRSFQYFSDLHLERAFKGFKRIPQNADNLLLAGDIGYPHMEIYREFFEDVNRRYERVFVVDGNHEWDKGKPDPNRFKSLQNVVLLNNQHYEHPNGVVVLGTTLWTDSTRSSDHQESVKYLTRALESFHQDHPEKKVIVLTHHLPSWKLIDQKYRKLSPQTLGRYANHLDYLMFEASSPEVWICGHSHSIVNCKIGRTHCHINTHGERHHPRIYL
jgi:predicted phosphodiesterase